MAGKSSLYLKGQGGSRLSVAKLIDHDAVLIKIQSEMRGIGHMLVDLICWLIFFIIQYSAKCSRGLIFAILHENCSNWNTT